MPSVDPKGNSEMLNKFGLLCIAITAVGCATTYRVPPSTSAAELSIEATIDGSAIGRELHFTALSNGGCTENPNGSMIASAASKIPFFAGDLSTGSVPIAAERLHFVIGFWEHRSGQDSKCKAEGYFEPIPGRRYKGHLEVKHDDKTCHFSIREVTSGAEKMAAIEKSKDRCPDSDVTLVRPNVIGTYLQTVNELIEIPRVQVQPR